MMNNEILHSMVPLGVGFTAYFVTHSLLASLWLKRRVHRQWPQLMPAYRLTFNTLSIILLIPLLWMMQQNPGPLIWQWTGLLGWAMKMLMVAAIIGFIWSLKAYDNQVFLGLTQWRNRHTRNNKNHDGISIDSPINNVENDPEQLHISTLHRFVRHPWYFFFLVLMWTQDLHTTQLFTYSLLSSYLVIGSWIEERKLIVHYGEAYREYCLQVPGLIPLPWRWLNVTEAKRIMRLATEHKAR
jgi:methanethiol S-methyltransferase